MFGFTGSLKVYVAVQPADMRKSFNGLFALTRNVLREDPCGGALFVFTNRTRNRVKILCWDGTGLWVMAKRLEKGTFAWPKASASHVQSLRIAPEELAMLLNGIDLARARPRPWHNR